MVSDETKEELHKIDLVEELINEIRNTVIKDDTMYLLEKLIVSLNIVEQQKQRADELEKRWNSLRDRLVEIYKNDTETGKQYLRSFLCLLDELEGKENVFETVQNLKD